MSPSNKALLAAPHVRFPSFLGDDAAARFLAFAQRGHDRMKSTMIGSPDGDRHDPTRRLSVVRRDLGEHGETFRARVEAVLPQAFETLGIPSFTPTELQIELVAHGDGGFFIPHVDARYGHSPATGVRRLTLVYYMHSQPRGFSGGALQLMPLGGNGPIDIAPEHDLAVAFPSWLPHQVLPVALPGNRFAESRFSVNVWVVG